ncbi:flagellar protein YcgR [Clostridium tepidiprofundi DSM 19306]|uniref:Flagellar protein YcgR n=1 Tax=Clostridium tepidiprofundi DSM 19306 TaxID=1121338 RepID=A0A151B6Q5_9CLOT|nr:flagellar brake domain-containing protein [Clostridium tepidiprofundi]KYH35618.1 flagellar protein YcgR [Clostridium tepidiprofundi DSM 19306]
MTEIKFLLNNKIEIFWNGKYYKSSIQDITDEYIGISIPTYEGALVPFSRGDKLDVIYYGDKNIYKFYSVVAGRKINRIPIILLSIPNEYRKVQRRRYVRVPYVKYINFSKVSEKISNMSILKGYLENEQNVKKGIVVDISGGGIRIKISEEISLGDNLVVMLPLDDENIILKCKTVRVDFDGDKYDCGLTFVDMDDAIREKIIKFIFKLMREHMRKI